MRFDSITRAALIAGVLLGALVAHANPRGDLLDRLTADLGPAEIAEAPVEVADAQPRVRISPIMAAPKAPVADKPTREEAAPKRTLDSLREKHEQRQAGSKSPMAAWFMVGLVLLGLGGVAWWLKHRAVSGNPWAAAAHRMETIATHRVTGKHMVSLVRVPGRILVLGLNDKGVNLLTELDESDLDSLNITEDGDDESQTFAERLSALRGRLKERRDPFRTALAEEDAPVDALLRLDERAAIRERLEALRRRNVA